MASFETKEILKGDWRLIAEDVTRGNAVKIIDEVIYRYKGVVTGGDKPKQSDRGMAWTTKTLDISSNSGAIDVYIMCPTNDGEIEVML